MVQSSVHTTQDLMTAATPATTTTAEGEDVEDAMITVEAGTIGTGTMTATVATAIAEVTVSAATVERGTKTGDTELRA